MSDPFSEVVELLRPIPSIAKRVTGGGRWIVERTGTGSPFYCAVVEGGCLLTVRGREPTHLDAGDFVLVPEMFDFTVTSRSPPPRGMARHPLEISPGVVHLGDPDVPDDVVLLVGHCEFASRDKDLLVSLLPEVIHVRGEERLTVLVAMIDEEARDRRMAREIVLARLLEVLLIEALRSADGTAAPAGLLRGLSDPQLAPALQAIHERPDQPHSVAALARLAAMSRSTFYEHFRSKIGLTPMAYVTAWRMALAKNMLTRTELPIGEVGRRVGYGSASAFSVAFARQAGSPPGAFAKAATNK